MRRIVLILAGLGLLGAGRPAAAQEAQDSERGVRLYGLGPRVGFSVNPDQFVFGGHADLGDLFPHVNLLFPVVEIGLGEDHTLTSIGGDFLYRFYDRWGVWNPYVGAEIALLIDSFDPPGPVSDTRTDLGLMGFFGVEKGIGGNRFAVEVKFNLVDSPDLKFAAIWTFGH